MTRTIVCFGDSNTHGFDPDRPFERLPPERRWPGVMRAALGAGYDVIEEGLNGRTMMWDSPLAPGRNGQAYLVPCLLSHAPVDLVTIMLGTNDLKRIYGLTAAEIASAAMTLVGSALSTLSGPEGAPPRVVLMAPAPLGEVTAHSELWGLGEAIEQSRQLARMYRLVAEDLGVGFFDAGSVAQTSPSDGVHLDRESHARLGAAMADVVRAELKRA
jgi:lysophospholipase L1-like esterase